MTEERLRHNQARLLESPETFQVGELP